MKEPNDLVGGAAWKEVFDIKQPNCLRTKMCGSIVNVRAPRDGREQVVRRSEALEKVRYGAEQDRAAVAGLVDQPVLFGRTLGRSSLTRQPTDSTVRGGRARRGCAHHLHGRHFRRRRKQDGAHRQPVAAGTERGAGTRSEAPGERHPTSAPDEAEL